MDLLPRGYLRRRQDETSETKASDTTAESAAATAAASGSDTATITSSASSTDSTSTSSSTDSSSSSSESPSVFSAEDPPPHTSTASDAYTAHGVNATSPATTTTSHTTSSSSSSSTTSTASKYVDPAASQIADAKRPGIPPNELTACVINGTEANNGPFCSPLHQQNMWVGLTYAITWNPDLMAHNASNVASFDYVDTALGNAWKSDPIPNTRGYVNIQMSEDWLKGAPGNDSTSGQNMTLHLLSTPFDGEEATIPGPTIALIKNPALLPKVKIPNLPNKYGLEVGLPIGVIALLFILIGICCGIRKNNKHHRSIRGVTKDYMAKRARRKGKGGDIMLEDYAGEGYQDQPVKGGTGNAFRDEISRQREEDTASLKRHPSSY